MRIRPLFCTLLLTLCGIFLSSPLYAANLTHFLSLSDIHFDPFISCTQKPCPLIKKLQQAPSAEWGGIIAQYDATPIQYGKDSNYSLLESALDAASKEGTAAHIQFVLMIGDFLAHSFDDKYVKYSRDHTQAGYIAFVKKTMEFLTSEINRTFPHTETFFAVGNNDSYQDDYSSDPKGLFFKDMGDLWSSSIQSADTTTQIQQNFYQGGYYAVTPAHQPELRIIVLNSVLFSSKARGHDIKQTAQQELDWLHQQLESAKQNKQHVLIAMHIPTGVDVYSSLFSFFKLVEFWKPAYSQRFLSEIQQASSSIMGIFTGHIHADAFQIFSNDSQHHLVPFTGTPSISPILGNNPGFKIYSYSNTPIHLTNFTTYFYALNSKSQWEKEYDFNEIYQLNHADSEIINGMKQLQPTGELANYYKIFYSVNTNSQPITKCNKWIPYYWCAIHSVAVPRYQECVSLALKFK